MRLLALVARQEWRWSSIWVALVGGLTLLTTSAYASTYATEADRHAAVLKAQRDAATTVLYGQLPDPGTPAQMFAWEIGAFTTILVAFAGVLLAVRLGRAAEDAGTLELVRACGVAPRRPREAALAWLVLVAHALAIASGGSVWLRRASLPGSSLAGAAAYGATIGCTFLLFALLTTVVGQVLPTTVAVRRTGALLVGAALLQRAWGDTAHLSWVSGASPLGLRGSVRPFTDDRPGPLLLGIAAIAALGVLAAMLESHREPGSGLLRPRTSLDRRLHVHSTIALCARLGRGSLATWAIAVTAGAALLTGMGSGVVTSAREGRLSGGFLSEQLAGADPAAAYFAYTGRIVGIVVAVFVVIRVVGAAADERRGLVEHVRATGARRWSPLVAEVFVAGAGAALTVGLAGVACALVAPSVIPGAGGGAAFRETVGQWPATVAAAGIAGLLVGVRPRLAAWAWAPLGVSVVLTLLGKLLGLPDSVVRLGLFGHAPADWSARSFVASVVLVTVGVALGVIGAAAVGRRDLVTG